MVRGVALAAILGPAGLGAISLMNLILGYSQYSDAGVSYAVAREIPLALGAGRTEEADELMWFGLVTNILSGVLVALGITAFVVLRWSLLDEPARFALIAAGALSFATGITSTLQMSMQARQRFGAAFRIVTTVAVLNLVSSVAGAYRYGIKGAVVCQVAGAAVSLGAALVVSRPRGESRVTSSALMRLVRVGLPIALLAFMGFSLENVDQVMVLSLLDRDHLGIYSIVLYGGAALYLLPLALSSVVGPRLLKAYGQDRSLEAIHDYTWRPVAVISSVLPVVVMAAWSVVPWLIVRFLPKFTPAVLPLRIYLVGIFFLGLNLGVSNTLLALDKHRLNVPVMLSCIALNVAVDIVFVRVLGLGLAGIALGSLVAYLTYWFIHSGLVRWFFCHDIVKVLRGNIHAAVPGLVLVGLTGVLMHVGALALVRPARDFALLGGTSVMCAVWWRLNGLDGVARLVR